MNSVLRKAIERASQGEFIRWDAEIYGRAAGKETIIIDASLMPVKDEQGRVVFITAEGRDITEKKAQEREIARQSRTLAAIRGDQGRYDTAADPDGGGPCLARLVPDRIAGGTENRRTDNR